MSENESASNSGSKTGTRIIRSRFPRAQPNVALSSGLARIRRLSGHYSGNSPSSSGNDQLNSGLDSGPPVPSTPPPAASPSVALFAASPVSHSPQQNLIESVLLSPRINHGDTIQSSSALSPAVDLARSPYRSTFRQFVISGGAASPRAPSSGPNSVLSQFLVPPGTPGAPASVGQPAYQSKFSKEHIMNIIKFKAMQKLKKNESESLRERRKKYKKSSPMLSNLTKPTNENEPTEAAKTSDSAEKESQIEPPPVIDRSKLRMRDFLYYNPRAPKKPDDNGSEKSSSSSAAKKTNRSASSASVATSEADTNDSLNSHSVVAAAAAAPSQMAAPQLKIADDGTIVINEESLVIQRETVEPVYDTTVVEESEINENLNYNSYRKFHHSKKWTARETARFYKALGMVGTDFTMIQKFFSHRSRNEIKRKFKREEKINQALIDKILSQTSKIDVTVFLTDSEDDNKTDDQNQTNGDAAAGPKTNKKSKKSTAKKTEPTDSDKDGQKKKKLKRANKRDFVGSESESEEKKDSKPTDSKTSQRRSEYKSRKFISDSDESNQTEATATTPGPSSVVTTSEIVVNTPTIGVESVSVLTPLKKDPPDDDGDEFLLDLDTNEMIKIAKIETPAVLTNEQTKKHGESDDDGDDVIIDLDNSTMTCNNVLVAKLDIDASFPKSSIQITKPDSSKK